MLNLIKNKKAKMEISIIILILAVLVLAITADVVFLSSTKRTVEKIQISSALEEVYAKAEILDFYLNSIIAQIENKGDLKALQNSFSEELEKYKDEEGYFISELSQVRDQVDNEHIVSSEDIHFEIIFKTTATIKDQKIYDVIYKREFVYAKT